MRQTMTKLFTLLVTAVMLLTLAACGKTGGTDPIGKYNCIAVSSDGKTFTAPESQNVYVELKKGGKGELFEELSFELTWKLDGEKFSGSYKIFGMDAPITGTLKDSVLEIHDGDNVIRYLKEGAELPGWASAIGGTSAEAAPEESLAGFYTLYAMEMGGVHYDYATLVEMDMMDSSYLRIDYDEASGYTGEVAFGDEDPDTFTMDEELGILFFASGDEMGFYEEEPGVVSITHEELGAKIFFALESVERPGAGAVAEPVVASDPLVEWWNGDWYGWWFMYGCKGSYEEFEGKYWDCEAHIEIDPNTYTGTMEMWDDEQYQNMGGIGMVDVSLSDSGTGSHGTLMSEGGWFEEKTLSHADWIIDPGLDESDNFLIITGDYDDDNGNVYYYKMMMRKWGELWEDIDKESRPWSYENWYKPMIEDGVTKMSVRFGDPDPSVYEDLESGQTEEKSDTETTPSAGQAAESTGSVDNTFTVEYGKSNAEATGSMDLETLKACYETLRDDPNHYEYLYEDVRDLMGCDGLAYHIDGEDNAYCWQSGNVIVTVTFKVLEDGNEECCAFFISGL